MALVEQRTTVYGTISIFREPLTGITVYEVGDCHQSSADSRGTSLASYIHAIFSLLTQCKAQNILIIGCGGGTLGTMLIRDRRKPIFVDIDPTSFIIAKQYFSLPDTVICHVADGEQFLQNTPETYDSVVLDAFHGKIIPPHLQTSEFFNLVRRHLKPGGTIFANVRVAHDFDKSADIIAKNMRSVWTNVRVLDAEGVCGRNSIVMAGEVEKLREPKLLIRPKNDAHLVAFELQRLRFRAWKVSRWVFGDPR